MSLTKIDNLNFAVTGRAAVEPLRGTSIVIDDGVIVGIGERAESADVSKHLPRPTWPIIGGYR